MSEEGSAPPGGVAADEGERSSGKFRRFFYPGQDTSGAGSTAEALLS